MSDLSTLRERMRARLPQAKGRYEVSNASGDDGPAVLRLYDAIDWMFGVSAEQFAQDLASISASEIRVEINSPGGDVFDGIAIYNALRAHPAHVTTRVDGLAASAASIVAQAGDHRVVLESAQLMIHNAWGIAIGPAAEMREFADLLEKQDSVIADIYASRSGNDRAGFVDMMNAETWFTDKEAVEAGLADEVVSPPRKDKVDDSVEESRIRQMITEALDLRDQEQAPLAGEREDTPEGVDGAQAGSLLAALTFDRKEEL